MEEVIWADNPMEWEETKEKLKLYRYELDKMIIEVEKAYKFLKLVESRQKRIDDYEN